MYRSRIARVVLVMSIAGSGCMKRHHATGRSMGVPIPATEPATIPTTMPTTLPATLPTTMPMPPQSPSTAPVATSALGTISKVPGLAPKPKPFIALPKAIKVATARPSTLLLEHASPDSPVPLSEYANQPVHRVADFHLQDGLSAEKVKFVLGPPAQLADADDPWLVYRLSNDREIWLHFTGPMQDRLDAADVIRGAEDGYVRDRIFPASHVR